MAAAQFIQAAQEFNTLANRYVNGEAVETAALNAKVIELATFGTAFRRNICHFEEGETLRGRLLEIDDMTGVANASLRTLRHDSFQTNDQLKREISKIVRIFNEVVICKCMCANRKLYDLGTEQKIADIRKVLSTLPETEIECRYNLKCTKAALKSLAWGTDTVKRIIKCAIIPIGSGGVKTLFSIGMSPPFVNPSPLIDPCCDVIQEVYDKLPEWWYRDVLALKWSGIEMRMRALVDYESPIRPGSDKTIKHTLQKVSSNHHIATYVCQIFKEVLDNPDASTDLKAAIFDDPEFSLSQLAEYNPSWFKATDKHWRVRYLALTYIDQLINQHDTPGSRRIVIRQMTAPNERSCIKEYAATIVSKFWDKDPDGSMHIAENVRREITEAQRSSERITELSTANEELSEDLVCLEEGLRGYGSVEQSLSAQEDLKRDLKIYFETKDQEAAVSYELTEAQEAKTRLQALDAFIQSRACS